MVIAIVPPVGPPIPVLVGKAIKDNPNSTYEVYLEKDLEKENVFFELDDSTMVFPNGTIIYQNGTKARSRSSNSANTNPKGKPTPAHLSGASSPKRIFPKT